MTSFAIDVPQALIERLKKGDARAYEQLYRRVYCRMYERLQPLYRDIRAITGYPSHD